MHNLLNSVRIFMEKLVFMKTIIFYSGFYPFYSRQCSMEFMISLKMYFCVFYAFIGVRYEMGHLYIQSCYI